MFDKKQFLINMFIPFVIGVVLFQFVSFSRFTYQWMIIFTLIYIIGLISLRYFIKIFKNQGEDQWNRRRLLLIVAVTVIVVLVSIQPTFNSVGFMIKHFIMFLLLAAIVTYYGYRLYKKYDENNTISLKKSRLIKGFIVVMVFVSVGLFSQLQILFINNFVIPPLYGCTYYDDYNNMIYTSQYAGSCPELENLKEIETDQGSKLSFTVYEEALRIDKRDKGGFNDREFKERTVIDSDITFIYDKQNRVTNYTITTYYKWYVSDEQTNHEFTLYAVNYFKKTIKNTYESNEIHSIHKTYEGTERFDHKSGMNESFDKAIFNDLVPLIEEFKSVLTKNTDPEHYTIDIDYRYKSNYATDEEEFVYEDLYDVRFFDQTQNGRYNDVLGSKIYVIDRAGTSDQIKIERWPGYNNRIIETFDTLTFSSTVKVEEYKYSLNPVFNQSTYITRESEEVTVDYIEDKRIEMNSDHFYKFTSLIVDEEYGLRLEHYHRDRNDSLRYNNYDQFDNGVYYKNNHLSLKLQDMYSSNFYYSPKYRPVPMTYQQNPLLFEDQLIFNDEIEE